jgi:hypothetical protein
LRLPIERQGRSFVNDEQAPNATGRVVKVSAAAVGKDTLTGGNGADTLNSTTPGVVLDVAGIGVDFIEEQVAQRIERSPTVELAASLPSSGE